MTTVLPLLFHDRDLLYPESPSRPKNPRLFELAAEFYQRELGQSLEEVDFVGRVAWVVVDETPDGPVVTGIALLATVLDISTYHVVDERANLLLFSHMASWGLDSGMEGKNVLVHIQAGTEEKWTRFLQRMGAKPADRWMFKVSSPVKVEPVEEVAPCVVASPKSRG